MLENFYPEGVESTRDRFKEKKIYEAGQHGTIFPRYKMECFFPGILISE